MIMTYLIFPVFSLT